jgi:dehydrogenase/reductase SDR family protein 12
MSGVSWVRLGDPSPVHSHETSIRTGRTDEDVDVIDLRALLDDLAEILVVPSFTRTGYALRRRLFDWEDPASWSLAGRTVVITGPTSGLGRAAADGLAAMGARLVLVGRDEGRLAQTRDELVATHEGLETALVVADMSSLASVRAAAERILATEPRIDIVVDNAGAMFAERDETPEGFERTFAVMVLGPFVLVSRLLPRLLDSPDGRVVAVTSGGQYTQSLPLDDLQFTRGDYDGPRAYARAKRAQVALTREWARRLRGSSVVANAMHPGWADTPGLEASLPGFRDMMGDRLRSAEEGVDTILWLAGAPEARAQSGQLFLDRRPRPFDRVPMTRLTPGDRRELWDRVCALTGEPDPTAAIDRASSARDGALGSPHD